MNNQTRIDIGETIVTINGKDFSFPAPLAEFTDLLGEYNRTHTCSGNTRYIWDNHGLSALSKDGAAVIELEVRIADGKQYGFSPLSKVTGPVLWKGKEIRGTVKIRKDDYLFVEKKFGGWEVSFSIDESAPGRTITGFTMYRSEKAGKVDMDDKYPFRRVEGEKLVFHDFNFKLLVLEELMYRQNLLTPRFDIHDFSKACKKRKIDIEEEGYDPVPEAVEYFRQFEIEKSLAGQITQLIQDGGNKIYRHIIPFWDGEDDAFDIQSAEDVNQFPNLKKMVLFKSDEKMADELRSKGIQLKWTSDPDAFR